MNHFKNYIFNNFVLIELYVISFLTFFCSGDTLMFGTNSNNNFLFLRIIILFICGIYLLIRICLKSRKDFFLRYSLIRNMCLFLMFIIMLCFSFLLNDNKTDFVHLYIQILLILFTLSLEIIYFGFDRICSALNKEFIIFTILGEFFFLIALLFGRESLLFFPILRNNNNLDYIFSLFCFIPLSGGLRFYGIFREPGVFGIYLLISLIYLYFSLDIKNKKKFILKVCSIVAILLAIFLTKSSSAYALLFPFILVILIKKYNNKKINILSKTLLVIFIISFSLFLYFDPFDVFTKFLTGNVSLYSRIFSPIISLLIGIKSPFFGVGIGSGIKEFYDLSKIFYLGPIGLSNTDTLFTIFSWFGIPFFCLFLCGFIYFSKFLVFRNCSEKKYMIYFMFFMLLAIFSTERLVISPLFYLISLSGTIENKVKSKFAPVMKGVLSL